MFPTSQRRWPRFSLRMLFVVVTLSACFLWLCLATPVQYIEYSGFHRTVRWRPPTADEARGRLYDCFCAALVVTAVIALFRRTSAMNAREKRRLIVSLGGTLIYGYAALMAIGVIVGAIVDYDRHFANPRFHLSPRYAIASIALASMSLAFIVYRLVRRFRAARS